MYPHISHFTADVCGVGGPPHTSGGGVTNDVSKNFDWAASPQFRWGTIVIQGGGEKREERRGEEEEERRRKEEEKRRGDLAVMKQQGESSVFHGSIVKIFEGNGAVHPPGLVLILIKCCDSLSWTHTCFRIQAAISCPQSKMTWNSFAFFISFRSGLASLVSVGS